MGKNKGIQFNLQKRLTLSRLLSKGSSAKEIGEILNMDPTSISREIKRNRVQTQEQRIEGSICFTCINKTNCCLKKQCGSLICGHRCVGCRSLKKCRHYLEFKCQKTKRFPYICNGCPKAKNCPLEQFLYLPDEAEDKARERLVLTREGVNLTSEEYEIQNNILKTAIIENGQSIHHALVVHKDELNCTEKTLYRRIDKGIYTVRNHHLPRQVKLKKRKIKKKYEYNHDPKIDRTGHFHSDWIIYKYKNGITFYHQMDFLGAPKKSKKEILVFTIPEMQFSLLYLIENATQEKITKLFDSIEREIGTNNFRKLFSAILTDRDTVFDDFTSLEFNSDGILRTKIFFCNPGESNQKANVENFNAQLRVIFPKHSLLDSYTQNDLYFAASNLNSRHLNSIDDKTPADLFIEVFGIELFEALHLKKIKGDEVKLKPIHS